MSEETPKRKVVFCLPTLTKPHPATVAALKATIPVITAAGWEEGMASEIGCPYISAARATMLRKALDAKATHVVFIDHDVSWEPSDMLKILEAEGEVVCGTYRFKKAEEEYMGGIISDAIGRPVVRKDGAVKADLIPAGFLRITRYVVNRFIEIHPELCYGERCNPSVDLFNHGAFDHAWWGEDYAFARRWTKNCGGDIWILPDMNIDHHSGDERFAGNLHKFLLRQPGGSESDNPIAPQEAVKAKLRAA